MSVHKQRTSDVGDDLTFVLSDGSVDRYGDIVEPDGWELANFKRNPIALFGHDNSFPIGTWKDLRIEGGKLLGRLALAAEGTSARIDELRALLTQKILRAVSVGFKPVEYSYMKPDEGRGIRYTKQELLEASVVTVPALPSALSTAKALNLSDDTVRLAFGEDALGVYRSMSGSAGGDASSQQRSTQGTGKMSLADRIRAAEADLVAKRDRLTELTNADPIDVDAVAELSDQIDVATKQIDALKRSESLLAVRAAGGQSGTIPPAQGQGGAAPAIIRAPLGLMKKASRPADYFIKAAAVQITALMQNRNPLDVLQERYADDEGVGAVVKAAVAGATTTAAGWAAELVNTVTLDFLETLRPMSVFPELAAAGGARLDFGPNAGAYRIPYRAATPSIGGSFVGEGAPIPVRRLGLGSTTLGPKKMGVISVFTREIARYSNPAIESLLQDEIRADTAITLDSVLLDTGAATAVRPAGLLNGVAPIAATAGGGADAFIGDILALRAPFDAAYAGQGIRLIMSPGRLERARLLADGAGTIGFTGAILNAYDPIASEAVAADTMIAIRAGDFVSAAGDTPEFETSDQTVLHMEDTTPLQIGTAGAPATVAAPAQSMFQTAQTAVRMLLDVNWTMRRAGMVQVINGLTW